VAAAAAAVNIAALTVTAATAKREVDRIRIIQHDEAAAVARLRPRQRRPTLPSGKSWREKAARSW
jgi:hypothetical protein